MNVYVGGQYWESSNIQKLVANPSHPDFISTVTVQGLFNGYVLLFEYDILFMYAIAGGILYFFRNTRIRYKLLALPVVILIGFVHSNIEYTEQRNEYFAAQSAPDINEEDSGLEEPAKN